MTEYQVDLLRNGQLVAGWTGPATSEDTAAAKARDAHGDVDGLDLEITKL